MPLAALVMLGYTIWRNVIPFTDSNPRPGAGDRRVRVGGAGRDRDGRVAGLAPKLSVSLEKDDETASTPDETASYVDGPLVDTTATAWCCATSTGRGSRR